MQPNEYRLNELFRLDPILAVTLPSMLCTNWRGITPHCTCCTYYCIHILHIVPRWLGPFALTLMFLLSDKFGGTRNAALASFGSFLLAAKTLQREVLPPQCPHTTHAKLYLPP